jgi:outer membrane protein OmpA-like peptidoglycan-associated protein
MRTPGIVLAIALLGCGSATPSPQLLSARDAYTKADRGQTKELVPDKILSAKQLLDRAERAFRDDPGSKKEITFAYVAERAALLAISSAERLAARADAIAAQRVYQEQLEDTERTTRNKLGRTAADLERARIALEGERAELERREQELAKTAGELKKTETALEREKRLRAEAEAKAAAALKSLEEIANIKEEQRGLVITLSGAVLFKSGEASLLEIAKRQLDKVAAALMEQDESKQIVVEGHTDSRGSDRRNRQLSQDRAEVVRNYLVSQGVKASRISAVGKGEAEPIANNRSAEGRANNRRVEIIVR